jgi:DNA-binding SARP family transcriptional activator
VSRRSATAAMGPADRRELHVRLLGQVEVTLKGEPFPLARPRKSLQVLAYLLLHRSAPVSRDFLAFALWPDDEEDVARGRLRSSLSDLLKILPQPSSDFVVVDAETLRWNSAVALRLDVDDFEAAARDPKRLEEAVELYRGDLLPEFYDEWIDTERERRRDTYVTCLLELVTELRRRGKRPRAIEVARKVLALDPWREDVVRRIMALRYELGDGAGALAEYGEFARRLRAEMGVDPMLETQGLAERLQRGEETPDEHAAQREAPARSRARDEERFPFVGRTREIERLSEAWMRACERHGGAVFVGGEAGIGKSRLVLEFMRSIEDEGARVLFGATGAPESFPYQSLVESLRAGLPLVAALDLAGIWFAALSSILPELPQRLAPLPPLPTVDAQQQLLRLREALSRTFAALAKPRPLLVVLEDLHWASEATLDALTFLARRAAGSRILLLATFRSDEASARHPLRRLQREAEFEGFATTLLLEPLDRVAVTEIVESSASDQDAADLCSRSNGNPLFLTQLLASPAGASADQVPPTIASLVGARVAALSPLARAVAEIAALAGQRFSTAIVREVAGWNDAEVSAAVDELLEHRIVRESTGRGIFGYAFAHQLVHQAVGELSDPERFRDRSRRMARAITDLYPERADELASEIARHFENGGMPIEAAARYLVAAKRALDLGALDDAQQSATRGLALQPEPECARELLLVQHAIHERLGDVAAEARDLDALEALAESTSDAGLRCTMLMRRARLAIRLGDQNAANVLADLRRRAAEMGSALWAAHADLSESRLIDFNLDLDRGIELLGRALIGYRSAGDDAATANALGSLGRALVLRGEVAEGRRRLDEALAIADRSGAYESRRGVLRLATASAQDAGDLEATAVLAPRWLELSVAAGDRREEAMALCAMAWLLAMSPDFARALPVLERAARICAEWTLTFERTMIEVNAAEVLMKLGDFMAAIPLLERGSASFASTVPLHAGEPAANLALALTYSGNPERAVAVAREALGYFEKGNKLITQASALESLAEAEWRCGEFAAAVGCFEEALKLRRMTNVAVGATKDAALLAALYAQTGDLAAARALLIKFTGCENAGEGDLWPQRTAWAAAYAHRQCGNADASERWLRTSLRLYEAYVGFLEGERRAGFAALPWHTAAKAAEAGAWPDAPW